MLCIQYITFVLNKKINEMRKMKFNKKRITEVALQVAAVATAVVAAVMVYKNVTSGKGTQYQINRDETAMRFRTGTANAWTYLV